mmetsp:Transcript_65562/g.191890  ORF Transcript_65562/g.191890 Transcript_65562/m.191890 type:complete len:244 (-) Transcript_65562:210-941(-)
MPWPTMLTSRHAQSFRRTLSRFQSCSSSRLMQSWRLAGQGLQTLLLSVQPCGRAVGVDSGTERSPFWRSSRGAAATPTRAPSTPPSGPARGAGRRCSLSWKRCRSGGCSPVPLPLPPRCASTSSTTTPAARGRCTGARSRTALAARTSGRAGSPRPSPRTSAPSPRRPRPRPRASWPRICGARSSGLPAKSWSSRLGAAQAAGTCGGPGRSASWMPCSPTSTALQLTPLEMASSPYPPRSSGQ